MASNAQVGQIGVVPQGLTPDSVPRGVVPLGEDVDEASMPKSTPLLCKVANTGATHLTSDPVCALYASCVAITLVREVFFPTRW